MPSSTCNYKLFLDIRPIAVGEALRRLVGKCLCQITKWKTSEYFSPYQFGVACPSGAAKIVHGLRDCVEEHWNERDFVVMKVNLCNAFNLVSRQALLDECSTHFLELLQWVAWCYGQHPLLWSPLGTIKSEAGLQQGDPLGPLLFCLVLQLTQSVLSFFLIPGTSIIVLLLDQTKQFHRPSVLSKIMVHLLGLDMNLSKCELFSHGDLTAFPSQMKRSNAPNIEILGAPVGDPIFCAKFIAEKRASASKFLALLKDVGSFDSQVALLLLRQCGGFCKLVHIARYTPPSLASEGLHYFDNVVRQSYGAWGMCSLSC